MAFLEFDDLVPKPKLEDIQYEIFGTITDIVKELKMKTELQCLSKTILDPEFNLYEVSRSEIDFSSLAEKKAKNYIEITSSRNE